MDISRLPVGYVSRMTQLQIACLYSAIANGGVLMRPQILRRIEDRDGRSMFDFEPQVVHRVISERASRLVLEALQAVTEPGGTATTAALEYYKVAGKTGTAHKYTGNPDNPYDNKRYYGSFAGVFPASDPKICIVVTVDEPNKALAGHYGGKVAGPIFAEIGAMAGHYLNIAPDKFPTMAELPKATNQVSGRTRREQE
jgi:cell division protein FtsI/penicillin-binding protein 2